MIGIIVIVFLLAASALVSGSEVAFFSIGPTEKSILNERSTQPNRRVLQLLRKPEHLLATILVANNFINVGIVVLSTWMVQNYLDLSMNPVLRFILQTIVITFVILLVGEIIPKVYATRYALSFSQLMAYPVYVMEVLFRPVSAILIRSTSLVRRRLDDMPSSLSMDELSHALELTGQDLEEDEQILKGIVKFGDLDVSDIMRPRVDILAVEITSTFKELLEALVESGFSRIPVYVDDLDHIKGILFVKDLLPHLHKVNNFRWQSLIRPPYFIPENKKINDLLEEFQQNKIHLAIVVDEYGGTSGLITLEDILEEIVGEISDESDDEESLFTRVDESTYLFSAKISLHDFCKALNIPDIYFEGIRGDSETLAGLILEIKGEMPEAGDQVSYRRYNFEIRSVDDRRIKEIQVAIQEEDPDGR